MTDNLRKYTLGCLNRQSLPPYLQEEGVGEVFLRSIEKFGRVDKDTITKLVWNVSRDLYWDALSPLSGIAPITKYKEIKKGNVNTRTVPLNNETIGYVESVVADDATFDHRDYSFVRAAIADLNDSAREVIYLLYFEPAVEYSGVGRPPSNLTGQGVTASEASRRLGITEAAVRARHKTALKALRKELDSGNGN